jgi:dTDP-4-amino-4,6-dideoxygalactose transaminase
MREAGVICMVYYPIPLHRQPVYASLNYQVGSLPMAETAAGQVLSLPMFPELAVAQQEQVAQALATCWREFQPDSVDAVSSAVL